MKTEITASSETAKSEEKSAHKSTNSEKLTALYGQRDKLTAALASAKSKVKTVEGQLAKVNDKIRKYELRDLDEICGSRKITVSDITDLLKIIPDDISLANAAEIISDNSAKGKNADTE